MGYAHMFAVATPILNLTGHQDDAFSKQKKIAVGLSVCSSTVVVLFFVATDFVMPFWFNKGSTVIEIATLEAVREGNELQEENVDLLRQMVQLGSEPAKLESQRPTEDRQAYQQNIEAPNKAHAEPDAQSEEPPISTSPFPQTQSASLEEISTEKRPPVAHSADVQSVFSGDTFMLCGHDGFVARVYRGKIKLENQDRSFEFRRRGEFQNWADHLQLDNTKDIFPGCRVTIGLREASGTQYFLVMTD